MRFWAVLVPWVLLAVDGCGDRSPPALWPEPPPPALAVPIGVEPTETTTPERSAPQRAEPTELAPPKAATPDSTDPAPAKPDPTKPDPKPTPAASAGSRPS